MYIGKKGNNSWQWKGCCNFQLRWGVTCSTPSCMLAVPVLWAQQWPSLTSHNNRACLDRMKRDTILWHKGVIVMLRNCLSSDGNQVFKPSPLFLLYNSETWTLTYTKEKLIDAFHRGLLRISINVRYPKITKSTKLYTLTQQTPLGARGGARL